MTDTTTADKPEALQIDPVDNATGETMCKVRFFIETPAGRVGAYHKAPLEYLLAARSNEAAMPNTVALPAAEWSEMEYWLNRCEDKGHLENCSDLLEPWANLSAAIDAARAKEGKA